MGLICLGDWYHVQFRSRKQLFNHEAERIKCRYCKDFRENVAYAGAEK